MPTVRTSPYVNRIIQWFFPAVWLLAADFSRAAEPEAPKAPPPARIEAFRTTTPPVIDGNLNDAVWKLAPHSDAFTQRLPNPGTSVSDHTTVRFMYDDDALYVAINCEQTHSPITSRLTRRDRDIESDWVSIALDTRNDKRSAFEFQVNVAGTMSDGAYSNDTDFTRDWDEIWDARVQQHKKGWSVEYRIPLHALRYEAKSMQSWGLQIRRYISNKRELSEWAFSKRDVAGEVSRYGTLENLTNLRVKHYVELLPYVSAKIFRTDPENSLDSSFKPGFNAGGDIRWHITPQLTLNSTINPDFGQVEADPAVLNTGNFEVFNSERRPFFVEGAEAFAMPLRLLYTRRIGRAPRAPALLDGEERVNTVQPSRIYAAEKLVGKVSNSITVGQLAAVTAPNTIEAQGPDGKRTARVAEPLATYKLFRVRADVAKKTQVGVTAMATNRMENLDEYPRASGPNGQNNWILCPIGDIVPPGRRCRHDAYVGAIDGRFQSASNDYVVTGQLAGTMIQNGLPRTFLDGTVVDSGDTGIAGVVRVAKQGGGNLRFDAQYQGHSRKVDYNDLGFMNRQNLHELDLLARYQTFEPVWVFQDTTTTLGWREKDTLNFLPRQRYFFLGSEMNFKNQWSLYAEAAYWASFFDDRELGDGAALQRVARGGGLFYLGADPRWPVRPEFFIFMGLNSGVRDIYAEGGLVFRVFPQLELSLMPSGSYNSGEYRYFSTEGGSYLFGRQKAQSLSLTLRSTLTFTPRLTLEAYAQAFMAAEDYTDYKSYPVAEGGRLPKIEIDQLRPAPAAVETNPNYEVGTVNANVVLRWEYRAGSTVFLVYTHSQNDFVEKNPGSGAGLSFPLIKPRGAADTILLKLSYWLG